MDTGLLPELQLLLNERSIVRQIVSTLHSECALVSVTLFLQRCLLYMLVFCPTNDVQTEQRMHAMMSSSSLQWPRQCMTMLEALAALPLEHETNSHACGRC